MSRGSGPSFTRSSGFGRSGQASRSNFVSRNFQNGGNVHHASHTTNFNRGNSNSNNFGRGNGNFNRGTTNFNRGNANRGNWNTFSHNRGNWNGGNHGNWNHGNWNHGNWNHGNWWGSNRGWHGYGYRGRGGFGYAGFYPWFGFGFGYPWLGWGLGWPYYYGGWGGYGGYCYGYPYLNLGYGYGYPYYGGYGYSYPYSTYAYADDGTVAATDQQPQLTPETTTPTPTDAELAEASEFVSLGEEAFKAGRYEDALRNWQHTLVDNPDNGAVFLLMAQALFALGQYDASANTVQMAMQMLPEAEWGNVVKNYTELYPNIQKYTDQIRAAEKARDEKPDDNAVRFLLGYHFGYLNYPKQAVRELDKALDIEPQDVGAQKLRDIFALQAGIPARPPAAAPEGAPGEKGEAHGAAKPATPPPVAEPPTAEPPATPPQTPPDKAPAADSDVGVPAEF